jgi:hypothetical protein
LQQHGGRNSAGLGVLRRHYSLAAHDSRRTTTLNNSVFMAT